MVCKYCNDDLAPENFFSSNKVRCKACIKAAKEALKKLCLVPGCENIIDHRASCCKTHANLARHNQIDKNDLEAVSTLKNKIYVCSVPGCNTEINPQSNMCIRHSHIAAKLPDIGLDKLLVHETREEVLSKNKLKNSEDRARRLAGNIAKCRQCKEEKFLFEFTDKNLAESKTTGTCKDCTKNYNRKLYHSTQKFDPIYKLRKSVAGGIRHALRKVNTSKGHVSVLEYLPYSLEELKLHLEALFTPEMSWENYGEYWVIDHIIPQAFFAYQSMNDLKFKFCWALENLRPLTVEENCKKSSILDGKFYKFGERSTTYETPGELL